MPRILDSWKVLLKRIYKKRFLLRPKIKPLKKEIKRGSFMEIIWKGISN